MSTTTQGLEDVVATQSQICDLDGKQGKLTYFGVDIHDLARYSSFEETAYLLWHGVLPTQAQLDELRQQFYTSRALPDQILALMRLMPTATPPMDILRTAVSALSAFDPDLHDTSTTANERRAVRLTSVLPTIMASWESIRNGRDAANLLYMLGGKRPDPETAHMLDVIMILHADHELNASTFAGRVTAGTLANMYAAITSAIGTLSGPLHGGANER